MSDFIDVLWAMRWVIVFVIAVSLVSFYATKWIVSDAEAKWITSEKTYRCNVCGEPLAPGETCSGYTSRVEDWCDWDEDHDSRR